LNVHNQRKYLRVYAGEPAVVTDWVRGRLVYFRLIWPVEWTTFRFIEHHPEPLSRDQIDLILDRAFRKRTRSWPGVESIRAKWDSVFVSLDGRARRYSDADTVVHGDWETRERLELEDHRFHRQWRDIINVSPDREYLYNLYSNRGLGVIQPITGLVPTQGTEEAGGPQPTNSPNPAQPAPTTQNQRRKKKTNNRRRTRSNVNPPLGTPRDPLQLWTGN
jgi:hypothetical protein